MIKYAVFNIGEEEFGIDVRRIVEIINPQRIYKIPELPDFVSGVIDVRGEIIPIIDLRQRFGIQPSQEGRIIVVLYDNNKIGLHVDEIKGIVTLSHAQIVSPPIIFKGLKRRYFSGLGKKDEGIIILLNIDEVLSSEEKIALKESEDIMQIKDVGEKDNERSSKTT